LESVEFKGGAWLWKKRWLLTGKLGMKTFLSGLKIH
jgi:hypothetical protein